MGKPIVYCSACGRSLREEDFEKRKAHLVDSQPYCVPCKAAPAAAPPARSATPPRGLERKESSGIVALSASSTRRVKAAALAPPAAPRRSRTPLLVGSGIAALALLALVVVLATSGRESPPPPPSADASTPESIPPVLRQLEAFAASGADPDAVLTRCDEARSALRGTPYESRLKAVEERAFAEKRNRGSSGKVDEALAESRLLQGRGRFPDALGLLKATLSIAGPRRADVERRIAEVQAAAREAETRPPEPPPPPPEPPKAAAPPKVTGLTLISADTGKPIAGFDPLKDGATLNLASLPTRNLNVRANTSPATVGSVKFGYDDKPEFQIENVAPYALAGGGKTFNAWTPVPGSHTLTATPYSASKASGAAGTTITIRFTVKEAAGPAAKPKPLLSENFEKGRGNFRGGEIVDGGAGGSKALAVPPEGADLWQSFSLVLKPTLVTRFKAKPLAPVANLTVLVWSPKHSENARFYIRDLKPDEWKTVEFRPADLRLGGDGKGPSIEGETIDNFKLYFDGPKDARVLLDDLEVVEIP